MKRRKFLNIAGTAIAVAGVAAYLRSDRQNLVRADLKDAGIPSFPFQADERLILYLASLAPSGHNTQPWKVKYLEPYHWIIQNDKTKWLPAVDPWQRETLLSIGAFIQNLEYAANNLGYNCEFKLLASNNRDEEVMEVRLKRAINQPRFDTDKILLRRTVRSGYLNEPLKKEHIDHIVGNERDYTHFFPNNAHEYALLNEQTIEANRVQTYRDDAQSELANWMRLSSAEAGKFGDGLTTASMEIEGVSGWVVRNFYDKEDVMGKNFRAQGLDKVVEQVGHSGGWLLITSAGEQSTEKLIETGRRLQRILLNTREKGIAIHPMTQILEEPTIRESFIRSIGIADPVQFILRTGYVRHYPNPVSLRRPVEKFVAM